MKTVEQYEKSITQTHGKHTSEVTNTTCTTWCILSN